MESKWHAFPLICMHIKTFEYWYTVETKKQKKMEATSTDFTDFVEDLDIDTVNM